MKDYIQYYGFSENPFDLSPDPEFFFLSETHMEALESLLNVVKERKGFMLLVGEGGTGKTVLIKHLIKSLDKYANVVYFSEGNLSYEQILNELLFKLKLSPKRINKASMLFELDEYIIQNPALGKNLILIIDDAQDISEDVLEELLLTSNPENNISKLLQIIFVGRPKLETKLNTKGLKQLKKRIGTISRIKPLSQAESLGYIDHRLLHAGCQSIDVFSPKAVNLIYRYSDGKPIKINLICQNAIFKGFEYSEQPISPKTVKKICKKGYLLSDEQTQDTLAAHKQKPRLIPPKQNAWLKRSLYLCLIFGCIIVVVFMGKKYFKNIHEFLKPSTYLETDAVTNEDNAKADITKEVVTNAPDIETVSVPKDLPVVSPLENQPEKNTSEIADSQDPYIAPATTGLKKGKIVNIKEGETLYSLMRNNYNHANTTLADFIMAFNPYIHDPDQISVNSKIHIPEITESNLIKKSSDGSIKAHLATFLTRREAIYYKKLINFTDKKTEIIPETVSPGKIWFRVMAGPFTNEKECLKMLKKLRQKGLLPAFGKITNMK